MISLLLQLVQNLTLVLGFYSSMAVTVDSILLYPKIQENK